MKKSLKTKGRCVGARPTFLIITRWNLAMPDSTDTLTIISRQEALAAGLTNFFSGEFCSRGHLALWNTKKNLCVICRKENLARWLQSNPKAALGYRLKGKDKRLKLTAEWKKKNPEKHRMLNKLSRERTLDKVKARVKRYALLNPHVLTLASQNRRSRERNAKGRIDKKTIEKIARLQKNFCAICKVNLASGKVKRHIDHIEPLARGGTNYPANIQILCSKCNQRKSSKDPIEHMQSLGYLL